MRAKGGRGSSVLLGIMVRDRQPAETMAITKMPLTVGC